MGKKRDEKYECGECGLVVVVDNPCGCSPCDLLCCNVPMKKVQKKKDKWRELARENTYV